MPDDSEAFLKITGIPLKDNLTFEDVQNYIPTSDAACLAANPVNRKDAPNFPDVLTDDCVLTSSTAPSPPASSPSCSSAPSSSPPIFPARSSSHNKGGGAVHPAGNPRPLFVSAASPSPSVSSVGQYTPRPNGNAYVTHSSPEPPHRWSNGVVQELATGRL